MTVYYDNIIKIKIIKGISMPISLKVIKTKLSKENKTFHKVNCIEEANRIEYHLKEREKHSVI